MIRLPLPVSLFLFFDDFLYLEFGTVNCVEYSNHCWSAEALKVARNGCYLMYVQKLWGPGHCQDPDIFLDVLAPFRISRIRLVHSSRFISRQILSSGLQPKSATPPICSEALLCIDYNVENIKEDFLSCLAPYHRTEWIGANEYSTTEFKNTNYTYT